MAVILSQPAATVKHRFVKFCPDRLMKIWGEAHFADLFRRVTMNILMSYRRFFRNQ
jgi:hypothetical protein